MENCKKLTFCAEEVEIVIRFFLNTIQENVEVVEGQNIGLNAGCLKLNWRLEFFKKKQRGV